MVFLSKLRLSVAAFLAGSCVLACLAGADNTVTPILRHRSLLAISTELDEESVILVKCARVGTYEDIIESRLVDQQGLVVATGKGMPGESIALPVPAGRKGSLMALEVVSGYNIATVEFPAGMAWALLAKTEQSLRTIREWGPLYFNVHQAVKKFSLWIHASAPREAARVVVRDSAQRIVLEKEDEFDVRTRLECKVPLEERGKTWSIAMEKIQRKGWYTDDITVEFDTRASGLLSQRAEWAPKFNAISIARDARSIKPEAVITREPYLPLPRRQLGAAYELYSGRAWRTSLPFTYVLDYGPEHFNNPDYLKRVASAPPTLLHWGKDVPFNHAWGAVPSYGGENVAYGKGEHIKRISAEEVAERMQVISNTVDQLHKAGVRYVTPYICAMTINGDPVKRSGFWEFYDHWDEYRKLGLAERPEEDPLAWLQTTEKGAPRIYYQYDMKAGFYPAFETNHRLTACWHTAGWRTWLLDVVRFVARTGCDGVFVDNGHSQKSCSPAALTAFRSFLKKRYSEEQARELLGIASLDDVAFPKLRPPSLLNVELNRFWCETTRDQMVAIKEAGTQVLRRDFKVFPNGGHAVNLQAALRETDFVMFEKSSGRYGTNPGLVMQPIFEGVTMRAINDNIFEYLFVRSLRSRVRPIILTRAGYPRTMPYLEMNTNCARLGMAECAAFSGGGGFLLRPRFEYFADALNDYREFFETHPELYAGLLPWRDTAVLALPEQGWLGNQLHFAAVKRMIPRLADSQVRFELLSESRLDADSLQDISTVAAFKVGVMSDDHLQKLADFVKQGGTLLVSGALAEKNQYLQPRDALPHPLSTLNTLADGESVKAGQGRLVRRENEDAFTAFLEERGLKVVCGGGDKPPQGVRLATYCTPDQQRLIVHLVNYNTPLGIPAPEIEVVKDITVELPLPSGREVAGFRALTPEGKTVELATLTGRAPVAQLKIPLLEIYIVAEVTLQ